MANLSHLTLPVLNESTGGISQQTVGLVDSTIEIKSATLAVNGTTVTFSNLPLTGDYLADFYITDGSNYTEIDTSTPGSVTLTYEPLSVVRTVYCKIKEV